MKIRSVEDEYNLKAYPSKKQKLKKMQKEGMQIEIDVLSNKV